MLVLWLVLFIVDHCCLVLSVVVCRLLFEFVACCCVLLAVKCLMRVACVGVAVAVDVAVAAVWLCVCMVVRLFGC